MLSSRTRGRGHKLEHRKFPLKIRKHFCAVWVTEHWHRSCCGVSFLETFKQNKRKPEHSKLGTKNSEINSSNSAILLFPFNNFILVFDIFNVLIIALFKNAFLNNAFKEIIFKEFLFRKFLNLPLTFLGLIIGSNLILTAINKNKISLKNFTGLLGLITYALYLSKL